MAWVGQSDEAIARDIERVWRDEVPVARKNGTNQHSSPSGSRGTRPTTKADTADSILARLKRDNPELAQRVINGEITANAAAGAFAQS